MGRFKVGDAVRVKAGSPVFLREPHGCVAPTLECHSEKLVIHSDESGKHNVGSFHREGYYYVTRPNRSVERGITGNYLEPWNDAETWCETTKQWVAKEVWQQVEFVEPPAPPKHKFSVGDQVRVVSNTAYGHHFRVGSIATITKLLNYPPAYEAAYEATGVCDDRDVVTQTLIAHDVESL